MSWLLDDLKHASGGERLDRMAHDAIRLAHDVLDRYPDIVRRHKYLAGGAAISSSLVVLAGAAVARRMRGGATAAEAVEQVTAEELSGPRLVSDRRSRLESDDGVTYGAADGRSAVLRGSQKVTSEERARASANIRV